MWKVKRSITKDTSNTLVQKQQKDNLLFNFNSLLFEITATILMTGILLIGEVQCMEMDCN